MDVETEKIIKLLFPEGLPEPWEDNPEFYQYLAKVGGYDVDRLIKEPEHLKDEKNLVQQNTQDLVFSNYKTFIQTAENSREIFKEFNQTETKLDDLLEKVPQFMNKCRSFCNKSKNINTHRRLNSLILSKNAELLEILELPQLMDSCLRSNQYNEALELSQYARHLNTKHGDILIVENIVNEVENSWSLMINQVVDSLKEDLPLPKCLQLIGLLRSMDAFTESELRIKFIQARDSWLQALLNSIPTEDANIHLTKTIELSRIHLFNIITQYKAMFNDDDHLVLGKDSIINDSAIFHQWLEEKVSQFLVTLERDLPGVSSIDFILGQCTYFGLSFGRVGADFTGCMSDIFMKVIKSKFENNISKATIKFEKDIENFILVHKTQRSDNKIESTINSENPPEQLLEYYPLAEYCNGLIVAFNELRLNTPIALAQSLTSLLQDSLCSVAKLMISYYKKRHKNFTPIDRENMVRFTECFSEQMIPYIQYCIHALFPPNQIALQLGTSVSQLQKEKISYLNQKYILEPVVTMLPTKNIPMDIYLPNMTITKGSFNLGFDIESELVQQEPNKEKVIDSSIKNINATILNEFKDSLNIVQETENVTIEKVLNNICTIEEHSNVNEVQ